jgi:hypothetical protein
MFIKFRSILNLANMYIRVPYIRCFQLFTVTYLQAYFNKFFLRDHF